MSGTNRPNTTLTRRSFLRATGAAAGTLGVAGAAGMFAADDWLAPTEAYAEPEERVAYTYHQAHCRGHCMLKCTVRDGRLCLIQPNDKAKEGLQTVCLKGLSEIQHVYSAERIQTPLKRVGERGANEFVAISWDEATAYFAEEVRKCWDAYGKQSVFASIAMESEVASELGKLLSASMDTVGGIDVGYANGLAPVYGGAKRSGPLGAVSAFNGVADWMNCKTLLFVGVNFIESSLTQTKPFFDAKDAGMHAIAIDPHYSTTATKCDEWIPLEPGTDAALFLGMITHVLDNGWYDEAYVGARTSLPFLVAQADGTLLRDHAVDPAATAPEDGAANPFLVWDDAAQAARPAADVESPALEGTFTVGGETYTTVLSLLKKNQQSYDTAWASKVTGIPADTIESLAEHYATGGPACIAVGYGGNDKYGNADIAGHAAGLLAAITGNIGRAGGGVGYPGFGYGSAGLGAWPLAEDMKPSTLAVPAFELPYVDSPVKCFIGVGDQIQQRFADLNKLDEWVQGLDFIVYADVYHSTGAQYADLVLPICSRFESDEALGGVRSNKGQVMLRQQVLEPLFESKTDFAFERELARALGIDASLPKTNEERIVRMLDTAKDAKVAGIALEELQANQGVLPYRAPSAVPFSDGKVPTASGRFDVYFPDLVKFDQALPAYEAPEETGADSKLRDRFPLQLCQMRTRFHIHNQFCDAEWIRQYSTAALHLNPADMEQRGLTNGDAVEAFNDRGSFACPVVGDESVRPGSARIFEGEWSKFMSAGNIQNVTNPGISDRGRALLNGPVIPYNDTLVEVKKA